MSTIGHVRTALQYFSMAQQPLAYALGHAMAGRPLNRSEAEEAEADLRRAADAIRRALDGEANVIRAEFRKALLRDAADDIGKLFATDVLIGFPTINTELPSDTEAPSDQPPRRA